MLKEICEKRGLPAIWNEKENTWDVRRKEIVETFLNEVYGVMPKLHDKLTWEVESTDEKFCAGNATLQKVILTAHFGEKKHSFPIYTAIPKGEGKYPYVISINFRSDVPDKYMPVEEICNRGFALISFDYQDVTADDYKLPDGGAGYVDNLKNILFDGIEKDDSHCGKIAMWSWEASLAMDYAQTLNNLDHKNTAVAGHSRLGKTALLTGARDERFKFILSNDSGCTGAAVARGKGGESISKIIERFGYWFCDNYRKYADNEDKMPFDQHFLLVSIAPRNVYVASGSKDLWADPQSEFLSCFAASEVYEKMGLKGFVCPDRFPETGEKFHEGNVGYHVRKGPHYFSREDWNLFLDYMEKHKVCEHNRDEMKIIAHRSGPTKYPEQTIQSAQLALENGADMIELDVRFTADKKIAVSHDKNVQRVFGVDKEVANMTAEEFLSLRHTENPAFSSHLFENYMKCGVAPILIHIKEDDIVDELLKCIDAYGYADKVVFGIQNVELVQKIKGHNKDMKILAFMKKPENIADYGATDVDYIRLWEGWLNEENINSVCKYNKALWIMTNGGEEVGVTTKENLNKIMDIGADGILINDITLCPKTAVLCLQ